MRWKNWNKIFGQQCFRNHPRSLPGLLYSDHAAGYDRYLAAWPVLFKLEEIGHASQYFDIENSMKGNG
jgi:hypothetical protein